jgi:hypothetical protein
MDENPESRKGLVRNDKKCESRIILRTRGDMRSSEIYEWEFHLEICVLCNIECGIKQEVFKLSINIIYYNIIYKIFNPTILFC